jgi:hypothetical protein
LILTLSRQPSLCYLRLIKYCLLHRIHSKAHVYILTHLRPRFFQSCVISRQMAFVCWWCSNHVVLISMNASNRWIWLSLPLRCTDNRIIHINLLLINIFQSTSFRVPIWNRFIGFGIITNLEVEIRFVLFLAVSLKSLRILKLWDINLGDHSALKVCDCIDGTDVLGVSPHEVSCEVQVHWVVVRVVVW